MERCPDCGERVYSLGCVKCNENAYIEAEIEELRSVDPACEHGIALDCHCCACRRSGFFPPEDCDCLSIGPPAPHLIAAGRLQWNGARQLPTPNSYLSERQPVDPLRLTLDLEADVARHRAQVQRLRDLCDL